MTDQTTATTAEAGAAPQAAPTTSQAATAPFPAAHRRIIQELLADAHALVAKIEATKVATEASTLLDDAKADIVSATSYIFAHFESLETKAKSDAATAETDVKAEAAKVEAAVEGTEAPPAAPASTDAPQAQQPGSAAPAADPAAPPAAPTA